MENWAGSTDSLKSLEKGKLPAPVLSAIIQAAIYRLQPAECSTKTHYRDIRVKYRKFL